MTQQPLIDTPFELPHFPHKRRGRAVVLGGGPTGLSTAWRLAKHGWEVELIEKSIYLGGHSSTRTINGYNVDDGPHKLYPQVLCAKPLIDHFVPKDDLLTISKKSTLYLRGKYIPFPFGIGDLFKGLGPMTGILCGLSFGLGKFERLFRGKPKSYTDFVVGTYGRYAHSLVFRQVAKKMWGDPDQIDVQLAKTRIIAPNLWQLIAGLFLGFRNKPTLSADEFYYPRNGLRQLWENMGKEIQSLGGIIHRESRPFRIEKNSGKFFVHYTTKNQHGEHQIQADVVVSTIPLKANAEILYPRPPQEVLEAAQNLKLSSLLVVYLVVKKPKILPVNWIFFPEDKYHFARLSEQKGFSPYMVPKECSTLMVEIPYTRESIATRDRETLIKEAIEQLCEVNILRPEDEILETFSSLGREVYPIYDFSYRKNLDLFLAYSDTIENFYLNGRPGLFCYNNMDHSMEMGLTVGDHIASGHPLSDWQNIRKLFYDYKIVD